MSATNHLNFYILIDNHRNILFQGKSMWKGLVFKILHWNCNSTIGWLICLQVATRNSFRIFGFSDIYYLSDVHIMLHKIDFDTGDFVLSSEFTNYTVIIINILMFIISILFYECFKVSHFFEVIWNSIQSFQRILSHVIWRINYVQ